jgi:4-aminobutyrate aminotransferase/(S)-3-amino-2-methylpropionate transaminase
MVNQKPGSPDLCVLSFKSGFHGRLFGSLSATRSKAIHKVDIPAFDWPVAPFPELKYPLEEHVKENEEEEKKCIEAYEQILIERWVSSWDESSFSVTPILKGTGCTTDHARKQTGPVAAVIIEPVLSEGGDKHASPAYFRSLRAIAKKHGAYFIVDEVQTGAGATGKFWAHEHWQLPAGQEPDFVTFSKKMQASGVFHKAETRPSAPYRIYGTWMGDPVRALQARKIIELIHAHDLVGHTAKQGSRLAEALTGMFKSESKVENLRGQGEGTFMAWDFQTGGMRDQFLGHMRKNGVQMGGCGERTVRLRPMLTFGDKHQEVLLSTIEKSMRSL